MWKMGIGGNANKNNDATNTKGLENKVTATKQNAS